MRSKILVGGVAVLVLAFLLSGNGKSQTKLAKDANNLQKLLSRFPQADADGNGILTEREAEEYRRKRQKEKAKGPPAEVPASATLSNVQYGSHERNHLDVWRAKSEQPTPALIFFHGGSFKAGDKAIAATRPILKECLAAGISVVSANYRFSSDAPYPAPMLDGARVVQFVRSRASEWNIDPRRIAVSGSSAGATLALWIALHNELADENSSDPVLRQSTRVTCASPHSGTAGLTSEYFRKHAGVTKQGKALWQLFGAVTQVEFDTVAKQDLAREGSPLTHVSSGDPPLFLTYQGDLNEAPFAADAAQSYWIHHVCLGLPLKAKYDELGQECDLYYKSNPAAADAEIEFLKKHLFAAHQESPVEPQAAAAPRAVQK
jgi:hypothetical protein